MTEEKKSWLKKANPIVAMRPILGWDLDINCFLDYIYCIDSFYCCRHLFLD